ncbi:hypothetical protein A3E89_00320 [Candidatus Campbellbacteria bacterium RIFCSPHIGHO2_12_FULL_35_10]|uniref:Enolase n=1 Tax=Candidatus Campbellbacteria bacterium RIFCSPHIGHO2_12_FULL_35_10 TaxID=1797578 RepID=A0A1F5ELZ8_9BACT|nr:MAG: hypothetical protein A3E89_00320 [Candidatus Campbellbacteria bacterium RIFCSPHIGHO2_12_FULL_35_10]
MSKITSIKAKEILDSRGKPTIEVEVFSDDISAVASVPSGKSAGSREAKVIDVKQAIKNIEEIIAPAIVGMEINPFEIDKIILDLDKTEDKSVLGGNTTLGVSLAVTRLGAKLENKPLWKYINEISKLDVSPSLPKLFMNVINGGVHADFRIPFQESMIVVEVKSYDKAVVFLNRLGELVKEKYGEVKIGDEGGFSPETKNLEEPFEMISSLMDSDMKIAIDVAGSEFYKDGVYKIFGKEYSSEQLEQIYKNLTEKFPIFSIEDPFQESDFSAFSNMMKNSKDWILKSNDDELLIVGDDLTTTNAKQILDSARNRRANAVIIKPNQIGTLTEVYNAIKIARGAGWKIICSHRSGETMDDFISDLAVGVGAYGIKAGSPRQKERLVKYERLQQILKEL